MGLLGYEHSSDSINQNIIAVRKAGGEVFVAELSGEVCGCVSAILDIRLAEGIKGEIVSLVVNKKSRGTGIGKGLVNEAEKWLSDKAPQIRVRANTIRKSAHEFYKLMGYSFLKSQTVLRKSL